MVHRAIIVNNQEGSISHLPSEQRIFYPAKGSYADEETSSSIATKLSGANKYGIFNCVILNDSSKFAVSDDQRH
jgi:hypothetical protein